MRILLFVMTLFFTGLTVAGNAVIDATKLKVENLIVKGIKPCKKLNNNYFKFSKCTQKVNNKYNKMYAADLIGTEEYAKKHHYSLSKKDLELESKRMEKLYPTLNSADDFLYMELEKGELFKENVGSANNFIHIEQNRRSRLAHAKKIKRYKVLLKQ